MINKKTLFKSLIIILLIIIIIVAAIQLRQTLARYETTTGTERDVDVAFWIVDNSFKSQRLFIKDIYPRNEVFEYQFTVSNYDPGALGTDLDDKIAETDLEYELVITTTTNLPLGYEILRNNSSIYKITDNKQNVEELYSDSDGTYYRKIKFATPTNQYPFPMDTIVAEVDDGGNPTGKFVKTRVTDTYVLKVTFPQGYSANEEYADLMEDITIDLSARQVIGE